MLLLVGVAALQIGGVSYGTVAQKTFPEETGNANTATPVQDPSVKKGNYLAYAGSCVCCHTRPSGPPFSGGVAFSTPLGTIYSSNITPDTQTGIGQWSAEDLRLAMHLGIARAAVTNCIPHFRVRGSWGNPGRVVTQKDVVEQR
jgi:hypothetical protein